METSYVYDFLHIFTKQLRISMGLVDSNRASGLNDVGVVVWKCTWFTTEYPSGCNVIIIANDITFKSGSFGPEEDLMFLAASVWHCLYRFCLNRVIVKSRISTSLIISTLWQQKDAARNVSITCSTRVSLRTYCSNFCSLSRAGSSSAYTSEQSALSAISNPPGASIFRLAS